VRCADAVQSTDGQAAALAVEERARCIVNSVCGLGDEMSSVNAGTCLCVRV
jgi:hypothetical protein